MPEYELLRLIWWGLLGFLLVGFAVMDGFDLGVVMWLPFVARKDSERRIVINSIGPVWEGNQVWLILGAGAIFAAWPAVYAVSFSCFYLAMLLALAGLILRPVSIKYRSKIASKTWRRNWDVMLAISGLIPSLVFGVAIGNILLGVPFYYDESLRIFSSGSFFQLFSPFALLCGLVSVCMLLMHGGLYLATKTEGHVNSRAITSSRVMAFITIVLFAIGGWMIAQHVTGYELTSVMDPNGPSNPLYKSAQQVVGGWMHNYQTYPALWFIPATAGVAALLAIITARRLTKLALVLSSVSVASIITTVGASMFPFILPSSKNPSMSLMVWDASSSQLTLMIMLFCAAIFVPIILLYTTWVYRVLRGKVTEKTIASEYNAY